MRTDTPFLTYPSLGLRERGCFRATQTSLSPPVSGLFALPAPSLWEPVSGDHLIPLHTLSICVNVSLDHTLLQECGFPSGVSHTPQNAQRTLLQHRRSVLFIQLSELHHAPWFAAVGLFLCWRSLLDHKLLRQRRFVLLPLDPQVPRLLNAVLEAKMRQDLGGQDSGCQRLAPLSARPWADCSSNALALPPPQCGYRNRGHYVCMFEVFGIFIK